MIIIQTWDKMRWDDNNLNFSLYAFSFFMMIMMFYVFLMFYKKLQFQHSLWWTWTRKGQKLFWAGVAQECNLFLMFSFCQDSFLTWTGALSSIYIHFNRLTNWHYYLIVDNFILIVHPLKLFLTLILKFSFNNNNTYRETLLMFHSFETIYKIRRSTT